METYRGKGQEECVLQVSNGIHEWAKRGNSGRKRRMDNFFLRTLKVENFKLRRVRLLFQLLSESLLSSSSLDFHSIIVLCKWRHWIKHRIDKGWMNVWVDG
jgi:hypothetical protein